LQSVDGNSGLYGWEAGVTIPLVFFSQSGKTKAANINVQITSQQYQQKELEIKAGYNQQISRYLVLQDVINYYRKEALPLANEQIQASYLAYKLGSIDYVQFIQNMETAINTKQEFLNQQAEYFELSAQI
jgi:cobalt-zinc-cadmium resistance protein CzcA